MFLLYYGSGAVVSSVLDETATDGPASCAPYRAATAPDQSEGRPSGATPLGTPPRARRHSPPRGSAGARSCTPSARCVRTAAGSRPQTVVSVCSYPCSAQQPLVVTATDEEAPEPYGDPVLRMPPVLPSQHAKVPNPVEYRGNISKARRRLHPSRAGLTDRRTARPTSLG